MRECVLRSEYCPVDGAGADGDTLLVSRAGGGSAVVVGCRRGLLWHLADDGDGALRTVVGADAECCLCYVDVTAPHEVATYSLLGTLKLYNIMMADTEAAVVTVARTFVQHHLPVNVTAAKALRRAGDGGALVLLLADARGVSLYHHHAGMFCGANLYPVDAPVHSLDALDDTVAAGLTTGHVLVWRVVHLAVGGSGPASSEAGAVAAAPALDATDATAAETATAVTTPAAAHTADELGHTNDPQNQQPQPLPFATPDADGTTDGTTDGSDWSGAGTADDVRANEVAAAAAPVAPQRTARSQSVDNAASALVAAAAPVAAVRSRVMSLLSSVVAGGRDKSPSDPLFPERCETPPHVEEDAAAAAAAATSSSHLALALEPVPFSGWRPADLAAGPALVAVASAAGAEEMDGDRVEEEAGGSCGRLAVAWMDGCLCVGAVTAQRWGFDRCVRVAEPYHCVQFLPARVGFAGGQPRLCVAAVTWAGALVFIDTDGAHSGGGGVGGNGGSPEHALTFDSRLFLGQRRGVAAAARTFAATTRALHLFDERGDCYAVPDVRSQLAAVAPPDIRPVTFKRETVESVRKLLAVARYADTGNLPAPIAAVLLHAIEKYEGAKRGLERKEVEQLEVRYVLDHLTRRAHNERGSHPATALSTTRSMSTHSY